MKKKRSSLSIVVGLILVIGTLFVAMQPRISNFFNSDSAEVYSDDEDDDNFNEEDDYDEELDYDEEEYSDDEDYETASEDDYDDDNGDITKLSDTPTSAQETNLSLLAQQEFDEKYPYKGSKMHKLMGVTEEWSGGGESWLFEVEATIVNAAGAERESTLVIEVFPSGPEEGRVTIAEY